MLQSDCKIKHASEVEFSHAVNSWKTANDMLKQAAHGPRSSAGSTAMMTYEPSKFGQTELVFGLWSELSSRSMHAFTFTDRLHFWPVIVSALLATWAKKYLKWS